MRDGDKFNYTIEEEKIDYKAKSKKSIIKISTSSKNIQENEDFR